MKYLLSLTLSSGLLALELAACGGTSSRPNARATAATSAAPGLEQVTLLARGME